MSPSPRGVAAHYLYGAFLNVTLADGESYRNALNLIVGELESWTLIVGIVIFHTDATAAELVDNRLNLGGNFLETFLILIYGHNHYLNGSQSWREHESVVIAVSHYEGLPSDAWRLPREVAHTYSGLFSLFAESHIERLGKILSKEMRRTDCSAFPSCIMASMVNVSIAPANLSDGVFTPLITGTAI